MKEQKNSKFECIYFSHNFLFNSSSITQKKMKRILPLLAVVLFSNQFSLAQTKPIALRSSGSLQPALPESVGVSSERLRRIDSNLTKWVVDGRTNGCVALVIRNGKIVYHKAFGYDDLEKQNRSVPIISTESHPRQKPLPVLP